MPSLSVTNFCYLLFFNFCNLIEIVILKPNDPSISAIVTKKPNRGTEVEVILKRGYLLSNVSDSEILKISGTYWPESSQENAKGAIKLVLVDSLKFLNIQIFYLKQKKIFHIIGNFQKHVSNYIIYYLL